MHDLRLTEHANLNSDAHEARNTFLQFPIPPKAKTFYLRVVPVRTDTLVRKFIFYQLRYYDDGTTFYDSFGWLQSTAMEWIYREETVFAIHRMMKRT